MLEHEVEHVQTEFFILNNATKKVPDRIPPVERLVQSEREL
jgi:hypothetical protein